MHTSYMHKAFIFVLYMYKVYMYSVRVLIVTGCKENSFHGVYIMELPVFNSIMKVLNSA